MAGSPCEFSESSYAFNFTENLWRRARDSVRFAPIFPNLRQEGAAGGGYDLLIRFGEACGVTRPQVETARQLPTTRALTAWCYETSRQQLMAQRRREAQAQFEPQALMMSHRLQVAAPPTEAPAQ